ncbi:MAG: hypothetical protein ACOX8W_08610 [bacterium]
MANAMCTQCKTELNMETARALTRTEAALFRLTAVKLFRCPRCGAIFVPKNAGSEFSSETVVATSPDELCDILLAGQRR